MKIIARLRCDLPTKFGLPRQSGLVNELRAAVVFEPEYRREEALRGLDGFSHIWLLWEFSRSVRDEWSPTVRPPRLGGNKRVGVFATRSPYRPNPIGLSSVKLESIERDNRLGTVLIVSGADLVDGTPIFDIKPYLPFTDSHPEAVCGFADEVCGYALEVNFPDELASVFDAERLKALRGLLAQDPRPAYIADGERIFGFLYGGYQIRFTVEGNLLTVCEVSLAEKQ